MNVGDRVQLADGRVGVVEQVTPCLVYFGTLDGKRIINPVVADACTVIPHPEVEDA